MRLSISSQLKTIPCLVGMETLWGEDGSKTWNIAVVKQRRNRFHFVNGEINVSSTQQAVRELPSGVPVVLSMEGRGVIHRMVVEDPAASEADYLQRVLPKAKYDEFYVQLYPTVGHVVVSVVRRKLVDGLVEELKAAGVRLLHVSLGAFALTYFQAYLLRGLDGTMYAGAHHFTFDEGNMKGYRFQSLAEESRIRPINAGGEEMNECLLAPFAAAVVVMGHIHGVGYGLAVNIHAASDYREQLAFMRAGKALLVFFGALLLANAFAFAYYSDKAATMPSHDLPLIRAEIDRLKQREESHENMLGGLLPTDSRPWALSYMADRVAAGLPAGMELVELSIFPRDEANSRKERRPIHVSSVIRIRGTCEALPLVNDWIQQLRAQPFCKTADLVAYGFDDREQLGLFTLNLTLNP